MLDPNMRIVGKQVYIRPITDSEEDTNNIIRWRNSDVVRPYFIYQKPFTVEGHRHWLETEVFTGKAFQFIVCQIEEEPLQKQRVSSLRKVKNQRRAES